MEDIVQTSGSCWKCCMCLSQQPFCHVFYIQRALGLFILCGCAFLKLSSNVSFVCLILCTLKAWWAPRTAGSLRGSTLQVNASLCSHFDPQHRSVSLPQSPGLSPLLVKPVTSATLFCHSPGTQAGAVNKYWWAHLDWVPKGQAQIFLDPSTLSDALTRLHLPSLLLTPSLSLPPRWRTEIIAE